MACRHLLAVVALNAGAMGHCRAAHTGFMPNLRAAWAFEVIQLAIGVRQLCITDHDSRQCGFSLSFVANICG
jgi:hypothetical protein